MTQRVRRIIVPVDFSEHARGACDRAFEIAGRSGAAVELLHAYSPLAPLLDSESPPELLEQLRANDRATFERFCAGYDERGYRFSRRFVERDPVEAIHSAAREPGASLIVMASHGRRGLDRLLLGSVTERTLQGAPAPVLVLREPSQEAPRPLRSVLLATDFSRGAEQAERFVACWARCFTAEVEVLHAIHETAVLLAPYAVSASSAFESEVLEAATRRMDRVIARLAAQGVSAKPRIVYGRPAESILSHAEAQGTQLVVMGSRGYSTPRRFLVGSVAQRVVRHAPCSVVIAGESTGLSRRSEA